MAKARLLLRLQSDALPKFLIAGSFAAAANWLVRFPLNLVMPYEAAVVAATAIGMMIGFILYQSWVFGGSDRTPLQQICDFVLVNVIGMIVTTVVAVLSCDALFYIGLSILIAEAMGHAIGILAGAFVNFFGHRHITFRRSGSGVDEPRAAEENAGSLES